jgi:hypothetical protein
VDPGAPCPVLDAAESKRLFAAGCLVAVEEEAGPPNPLRRRREAQATLPPAAVETPAARAVPE